MTSEYNRKLSREKMYQRRLASPAGLQYSALLQARGHATCAICGFEEDIRSARGRVRRLVIDHDHATGIVRDLLCSRCNKALGLFRDDVEVVLAAAQYLIKHRDDPSGIVFHELSEPAA